MAYNSLGRDAQAVPSAQATRKNAGGAAGQDNVRGNSDIQGDGTPTNLGVKPTNPKSFFKPAKDYNSSGLERAAQQLADKLHKR
jgi:hypothetical protein